jgi:7-cyano-7-deazaguanine synthase in queuosine biosynthesis
MLFLIGLITMNIRKKDVSQRSVLMRILTNHLQIITVTFAYNMRFPNVLTDMMEPLSRTNSSSESIVSFDCFASASQLKLFAPSIAILKVMLSGLSPILLII